MKNLASQLQVILKLIVSLGLIYWVIKKFPYQDAFLQISEIQLLPIFLGVTISLIIIFVQCLRWKLLLLEKGETISFRFLLKFILYGYALNLVVPLGVGADIVKSYSLGKAIQAKSESISAILFAKILGLAMVMLLLWVAIPFASAEILPNWLYTPLSFFSLIIILFCSMVIFKPNFMAKFIKIKVLQNSISHIQSIVSQPRVLLLSIVYSLAIQVLISIIQYLFYYGVGAELPFWDNVIYFAVLSLLLYLPISIGGVGLREATSIFILGQLMGVSDTHCIQVSILAYLLMLLQASLGLLTYIFSPKGNKAI